MTDVSVIMPLYRAEYIGWFGIESLCYQKDIDFKWELVIAEEEFPHSLGIDRILTYSDRLKANGCSIIKYIKLPVWIPLSMKYSLISTTCAKSKVFFIQVADYWSPPYRMKKTLDIFSSDLDWVHGLTMLMYDIKSNKVYIRDKNPIKFWMALNMKLAKKLPISSKKKGCDQYLIDSCTAIKGATLTKQMCSSWGTGVVIHGLNNLTKDFSKFRAKEVTLRIETLLPEHIVDKLKEVSHNVWGVSIPSTNIPTIYPNYTVTQYKL